MLAGEDSGDQLGGDLIAALRQHYPEARIVGIGGAHMQAQGFDPWYHIRQLSLFGFTEVIRHLPRLLALRKTLIARLLALRPDVIIGIDAPDFNLEVEHRLKRAGLPTIHYVSPSVWAWREQRVERIGRSADRVLCLFPFEPAIYAKYGIDARFVGHPLADRFALVTERAAARNFFKLPHDPPVLAVLPGSRPTELARMGDTFMAAIEHIMSDMPNLWVLIPAANPVLLARLRQLLAKQAHQDRIQLIDGHAHTVMRACDVVLLASGTAALEAMLAKRPMVAGYRISPLSYYIARVLRMLHTDVYTLPNILARTCGHDEQSMPVPELIQHDFTARNLAQTTLTLLNDSERRSRIVTTFESLHQALCSDLTERASDHAARAVIDLIEEKQSRPLRG